MSRLLCLMALLAASQLTAQMDVSLGGMRWQGERRGDFLVMEVYAPTQGWVGVGFNRDNGIVGSDLLLLRVLDGKADGTDLFVKGAGDPRTDESLGGSHDLEIIDFAETREGTYLKFRRPWPGEDTYDFPLREGESFWLILAYSTHDDFGHHSRMRQHEKVVVNLR